MSLEGADIVPLHSAAGNVSNAEFKALAEKVEHLITEIQSLKRRPASRATKARKAVPRRRKASVPVPVPVPPEQPLVQPIAAPTEEWVVMFGVQLWPSVETRYGDYTFDQVRAAVWTFRDMLTWLSDKNSPSSRAIVARLSVRWLYELIGRLPVEEEARRRLRKAYELIQLLTRLYEDNPSGECIVPPTPTREGEW